MLIKYKYGKKEIAYDFQSQTIAKNFEERREDYNKKVSESLSCRFKVRVECHPLFSDLILYHRLNTNYFYVEFGGVIYSDVRAIIASLTIK